MTDRLVSKSFVHDSTRWDGFALRDDDIIISTPAKCGTTWSQMLCALLLFRTPDLPAPLAVLSPWLEMNTRPLDEVVADLEAQQHRRFIKSHTRLDALPWDPRVTYLHVARDPRDVASSWDDHMTNADLGVLLQSRLDSVGGDDLEELGITGPPELPPDDPAARFWWWVDAAPSPVVESALQLLTEHVASFWARRDEPNVHLFHYGDLRADLAGQMARLAEILGVDPPTDELVEAATFESMKGRADELAPNADIALFQSNAKFFEKARSGDWRALMADGDAERYRERVGELVPADLADWLHEGWLGTGSW